MKVSKTQSTPKSSVSRNSSAIRNQRAQEREATPPQGSTSEELRARNSGVSAQGSAFSELHAQNAGVATDDSVTVLGGSRQVTPSAQSETRQGPVDRAEISPEASEPGGSEVTLNGLLGALQNIYANANELAQEG